MTLTISRERRLPREGGFETRPYKSPDFVRWLAKGVLWKPAEFRLLPCHFEAAA